mmetsp:Transcript_893/g.2468  ORF Transcript_893/g.2468 Transcript_893/m.2468 type:complete len:788 (+) Transcript_893:78-2441(+)
METLHPPGAGAGQAGSSADAPVQRRMSVADAPAVPGAGSDFEQVFGQNGAAAMEDDDLRALHEWLDANLSDDEKAALGHGTSASYPASGSTSLAPPTIIPPSGPSGGSGGSEHNATGSRASLEPGAQSPFLSDDDLAAVLPALSEEEQAAIGRSTNASRPTSSSTLPLPTSASDHNLTGSHSSLDAGSQSPFLSEDDLAAVLPSLSEEEEAELRNSAAAAAASNPTASAGSDKLTLPGSGSGGDLAGSAPGSQSTLLSDEEIAAVLQTGASTMDHHPLPLPPAAPQRVHPQTVQPAAAVPAMPMPVAVAVGRPVALSNVPIAAAAASSNAGRKNPVVVVAPTRGGKKREVERYVTSEPHAEKRVKETRVCVAGPGGRAGGTSACVQGSGTAGSSSTAGAGSSSHEAGGSSSQGAPAAPGSRPRCPLCGSTMRGFGRGYCSNVECRENSTLVVRYDAKPAMTDKQRYYEEQAGPGPPDSDDDASEPLPKATPVSSEPSGKGAAMSASPAPVVAVVTSARPARPGEGSGAATARLATPSATGASIPTATVVGVTPPAPSDGEPHHPAMQHSQAYAARAEEQPPSYESLNPPRPLDSPTNSTSNSLRVTREDPSLKKLSEAYIFGVPLGWLGLHWFYLDRFKWGVLYLCTFGLLGVGWAIDILRMPILLHRARKGWESEDAELVDLGDAYALCLSPLGLLLGLHHWYLKRYKWATWHMLSIGFLGIGWAFDLFRLPFLVSEHNEQVRKARRQSSSAMVTTSRTHRGQTAGQAQGAAQQIEMRSRHGENAV